jgi:glycosyltransferase involved in cell wall biosynthesis
VSELVSILIPAYKAERFVGETIQSALDQTWTNKEIIVVDDGSPDATFKVAKYFESSSVKVVRQDNGGAPSARNAALALAQGDYIQWLDADDLLHPEKISQQMEGAESGTTARTLRTCAWGRFFFRTDKAEFSPDPLWQDLGPIEWIQAKFAGHWMNPVVWLVSRRLAELAGPWDSRLARSGDDDGEYICRVVAQSDRVHFVTEAKCYYRVGTPGSLNWKMETNQAGLESLALSLETTARHLLALENSPRTRAAAFEYLQVFLPYFYGAEARHYQRLTDFAQTIGYDLAPPKVHWKYRPLEFVAGPRVTSKVISNWRALKILARRRMDNWLYQRARRVTR